MVTFNLNQQRHAVDKERNEGVKKREGEGTNDSERKTYAAPKQRV